MTPLSYVTSTILFMVYSCGRLMVIGFSVMVNVAICRFSTAACKSSGWQKKSTAKKVRHVSWMNSRAESLQLNTSIACVSLVKL